MSASHLVRLARLTVFVLACTCSGALPPTHYYTLRPQPAGAGEAAGGGAPRSAAAGLAVGVETFRVDPPYDQDRIVFRPGPDSTEVGFYAYHRWAAPLGRLVAVAIADGLRDTPGIASIEPAVSTADYSARLGGRVLHLEEVDRPDGPQARIALAIELTGGDGGVLWSGTLRESATGPAATPAEIAGLMERALSRLLERLRGEFAAELDR